MERNLAEVLGKTDPEPRTRSVFASVFWAVLLAGGILGAIGGAFWGLSDADGDGVPRWSDRCPDRSGIEALHGCPMPTLGPQ